MMKYYAIIKGIKTGIFTSWDECKEYVLGYNGADYKSFSNEEDAISYLNSIEAKLDIKLPTVYVDGSYNSLTEEYSFGGVLIIGDKLYKFKKKFGPDEYSSSRNVAGEIRGAGYIINYCIKKEMKEINLYYDYIGIEKWFDGSWKSNSVIGMCYQKFVGPIKDKIKVNFFKVKSHTNDKYNDMADSLAKEALGIS